MVNSDASESYMKGQLCPYRIQDRGDGTYQPILCQEGYCSGCEVHQSQERNRQREHGAAVIVELANLDAIWRGESKC